MMLIEVSTLTAFSTDDSLLTETDPEHPAKCQDQHFHVETVANCGAVGPLDWSQLLSHCPVGWRVREPVRISRLCRLAQRRFPELYVRPALSASSEERLPFVSKRPTAQLALAVQRGLCPMWSPTIPNGKCWPFCWTAAVVALTRPPFPAGPPSCTDRSLTVLEVAD